MFRPSDFDIDEMLELYLAGQTPSDIATLFGALETTIGAYLQQRGAAIPQSAIRQRAPASKPLSRAATRQVRQTYATAAQRALADQLLHHGVDPVVLQEAVGRHNVDVGAYPVAVDLAGCGWHAQGTHRQHLTQRTKDLADRGWNQLIVWTHAVHRRDLTRITRETLEYYETSRRDPTVRRQYRVIWADGQFIAAGEVDDDTLSLVPSGLRSTRDRP